ncbi:MAG: hypothetical protein ACJ76N_07170 [Thermoanaerobaculia bacterium]
MRKLMILTAAALLATAPASIAGQGSRNNTHPQSSPARGDMN